MIAYNRDSEFLWESSGKELIVLQFEATQLEKLLTTLERSPT